MTTQREYSDVQFALLSDGSVLIHQKFPDGRCTSIEVGTVEGLTAIIDGLSAFQKRCFDAGYGKRGSA